mmetsp:Transcript_15063/g.32655  ORF Transcript_15063/g.32655 Transcript_15063/m.32655 type:complete len:120 (-) Transcript_15063:841-1200(-)|eukprot:CAMPEP_0202900144 /NCGR_PEP_ID=MMETSP1392-20130828/10104_1 /ASSEMBLY_ACC=CAM_ASM_000868 /TAXON_ID=225041 /ORGANISM="Chlamydomonas chlamydogama, Strain SAG 11-48b" /LENGTH=119 /DNA_ID=CAMNT_0049586477 /DNA_START=240 /DNA_END=599 /DNA_ORIENTATION=+
MAYNLYQVQMARAWAERIEKENAQAEKFWMTQAMKNTQTLTSKTGYANDGASVAGSKISSAAPSGYTSKTSFLKDKLEKLETELHMEREHRKKVEEDLEAIKSLHTTGTLSPKPGTPRY